MARKPENPVKLTRDELERLHKLIKSGDTNKTRRTRCQILLAVNTEAGKSMTYKQCEKLLGVSSATISTVVKNYKTGGIDRVLEMKRNVNSDNTARKVDGRVEAQIITLACGPVPEGRARWTIRLLEEKLQVILQLEKPISREAIRRTLKKTNLDLTATNIGASPNQMIRNS